MRKAILAVLMFLPCLAFADIVGTLGTGESVMVTCVPTDQGECPAPAPDVAYAHGGDHKRMTKLNQDCRTCHGQDLQGTLLSVANFARTCIAPDRFRMPMNAMDTERWITTWPDGELLDIVGTQTARIEVGDVVGCQMCHSKVEFRDASGNRVKVRVRFDNYDNDRNDDDDEDECRRCDDDDGDYNDDEDDNDDTGTDTDTGGGGGNPGGGTGGGTVDVYSCFAIQDSNSRHRAINITPATNCSSCHGDGRVCE